MDIARQVAQQPIDLPDVQAAGPGALEQLGFQQAARTGVGAGTVQQGIQQIQGAAAPIGAAAPCICAIPWLTVPAPTPVCAAC